MAGTAQATIAEFWPDHVMHKDVNKHPRWDESQGIVCACGEVLGWPVQEPPEGDEPDPEPIRETLSQTLGREAREKVAAARAKLEAEGPTGRDDYAAPIVGAFGSYGGGPTTDVQLPTVIEDGDGEDVGFTPMPENRVDPDGTSWGPPPEKGAIANELARKSATIDALWNHPDTQAAVREAERNFAESVSPERGHWPVGQADNPVDVREPGDYPDPEEQTPPDEAQAGPPYAVGDTVTVAGIEFVKHSESPFPEHNPPAEPWAGPGETIGVDVPPEGDDGRADVADTPPWNEYEDYGGGPAVETTSKPFGRFDDEKPSNEGIQEEEPEVGRDLVPYAGTPLMPTDSGSLDPLNRSLPPLDPSLPYTPADVELKILEVLQQGERGERFLREQLARLHQAQHNLDLRYNLAIRKSDARAADQRKADAWIATERERYEATEAEMLVRALRDNLHNLRAQLSGFQSVARSLGVSLTNSLDGRDLPKRIESSREPPAEHWSDR